MGKLGISIYPEKTTEKEVTDYIDKAGEAGFSRIFSCLLSVNKSKEVILEKFKKINHHAKEKGFEIILDVNPKVFNDLGISYDDLSFFKEMNADGIRLDIGFTGLQESIMTFNKENLKIEINMSNITHYIDTIMDYRPNKDNLIGCHNFYPHIYTGLGLDFFKKCTENFAKYGLRTAAFITSQTENTFGPWPVTQGLPTLEMHRNLPMIVQFKHFVALEMIDDIIISNCYPTDEELEEFRHVINEKLKLARRDYEAMMRTLMNADGNDVDDTSPTYKVLEEGSATQSKEELIQLANRQQKFITGLEAALVRIANKTYGIDRITGELIPKQRLMAVPHATLSVESKNARKR